MPLSNNYLINPLHPLINQVKIIDIQSYSFDSRWFNEPPVVYQAKAKIAKVAALKNELFG